MSISFSPSDLISISYAVEMANNRYYLESEDPRVAAAVLVVRALGRFEREFEYYQAHHFRGGLKEVRLYHRMLIKAVADFDTVRGGPL